MDRRQLSLNGMALNGVALNGVASNRVPLSRIALALAALLAAAVAPPVATAEIYQWKDANGRVHFGDRAQDGSGKSVARRIAPATVAAERLSIRIDDESAVLDDTSRAHLDTGIRRIYDIYTGMFRLGMRRPVVVDIHLFGTHAEMGRWANGIDRNVNLPPGVLGLYMAKQNVVGAWRHSDDPQRVLATLLHESSHVLLSQLSPDAPAWLQEGLAQYFEGLDPAADGYVIRPTPDAAQAIATWVARKQLVTLDQYFSLDEQRWRHLAHVEQNPVPYVVAWSVSYFLMSKPVGRQIVGELLQDMEKTRRPPTANAIEKRYPGGYALMEYEWFKWAQGEKKPQTLSW